METIRIRVRSFLSFPLLHSIPSVYSIKIRDPKENIKIEANFASLLQQRYGNEKKIQEKQFRLFKLCI